MSLSSLHILLGLATGTAGPPMAALYAHALDLFLARVRVAERATSMRFECGGEFDVAEQVNA